MAHNSTFDRSTVIAILKAHTTLSHHKAKELLALSGISITHTTIAKIRRDEKIAYGLPDTQWQILEKMQREGVVITRQLIKRTFPKISDNYLYVLSQTYVKKPPKVSVEAVENAPEQFLIRTKVGHVTRIEWR